MHTSYSLVLVIDTCIVPFLNISTQHIISASSTAAVTEHDINTSQQTPPMTTTSTSAVIKSDLIISLMITTKGEYFYDIVMYKLS